MRRENNVRNVMIAVLCFAVFGLSIACAALSSNLKLDGTATVKSSSWDVHFENLSNRFANGQTVVSTEPLIDGATTTVSYGVILNEPGDSYEFTVDVVNKGSIDARLYSFDLSGVSAEQDVYVNYSVTECKQGIF